MISMIFLCFKNLGLRNVAIAQASPVARLVDNVKNPRPTFSVSTEKKNGQNRLAFKTMSSSVSISFDEECRIRVLEGEDFAKSKELQQESSNFTSSTCYLCEIDTANLSLRETTREHVYPNKHQS